MEKRKRHEKVKVDGRCSFLSLFFLSLSLSLSPTLSVSLIHTRTHTHTHTLPTATVAAAYPLFPCSPFPPSFPSPQFRFCVRFRVPLSFRCFSLFLALSFTRGAVRSFPCSVFIRTSEREREETNGAVRFPFPIFLHVCSSLPLSRFPSPLSLSPLPLSPRGLSTRRPCACVFTCCRLCARCRGKRTLVWTLFVYFRPFPCALCPSPEAGFSSLPPCLFLLPLC